MGNYSAVFFVRSGSLDFYRFCQVIAIYSNEKLQFLKSKVKRSMNKETTEKRNWYDSSTKSLRNIIVLLIEPFKLSQDFLNIFPRMSKCNEKFPTRKTVVLDTKSAAVPIKTKNGKNKIMATKKMTDLDAR